MNTRQASQNGYPSGGSIRPGKSRGGSFLKRVTSTLIDARASAWTNHGEPERHLRFSNVTKLYATKHGHRRVIDQLSLDFPRGRNIAILGKNGAGKSTLMRMIAGSEAPSSGKITRETRISWPLGLGVGVHPALSALENCRFVARIYNADPREVIDSVEEFADVGAYFHMPVRTLSSGMRARVNFGLSMAIQFDCYLIDELTAVGDRKFQEKCREAFAERLSSADVIMVSHQASTVKSYCEMAAVLQDGKIRFYDSLEEATEIYQGLA
ncbi:capsular polysaccharide transport system ATP-binding protein [Breoghania corrubedonensis]|uniref:Capsular polysaccharide transport system ATP-binding protein n=1 Tax=Breoghania corrubedonensis TaxID=665038 RepID=A0A2T5VB22_9HYPH|nr:ABC transporter ATP-binding protein [Breoghania corrubedonensis]PTW60952.1 capsular polysaccharide transport system ATP-binding protein [Breoghania corrubedonensis]